MLLASSFMPGIDLLLQIVFILCGGYILYTWKNIERWSELPLTRYIYPNGSPVENSKEPEAFLKFMKPRMLIVGLVCFLSGVLSVVNAYALGNNMALGLVTAGCGFAAMIFYMVSIGQASKRYM